MKPSSASSSPILSVTIRGADSGYYETKDMNEQELQKILERGVWNQRAITGSTRQKLSRFVTITVGALVRNDATL